MKNRLLRHLRRWHRCESGAIAMLMLVAFIILMMLGWALYDSGEAARQKIKTQGAADAAAVSQVAVKARAMNMMAYSNVAKRSIFAIHTTYISHFLAYIQWGSLMYNLGEMLIEIDKPEIGQDISGMGTVWIQWWQDESRADFRAFSNVDLAGELELHSPPDFKLEDVWEKLLSPDNGADAASAVIEAIFSGSWEPIVEEIQSNLERLTGVVTFGDMAEFAEPGSTPQWAGYSLRYHAQDIKALDNYQRYIAGITPWWAWSEQLVRGLRNGATATGTFPLPHTFEMGLPNTLNDIAQTLGANAQLSTTTWHDTLPVRPGDGDIFEGPNAPDGRQNMADVIKEQLDEADLLDTLTEFIKNELDGGGAALDFENISDTVFFLEHIANVLIATLDSSYPELKLTDANPTTQGFVDIFTSIGFPALVASSTHSTFVDGGLGFVQDLFDEHLGKATASPWTLLNYPTEGEWLTKTSNLVFAYKSRHQLYDEERTKYDVIEKDYQITDPLTGLGGPLGSAGETIYRSSGYWAMSRAEIFFNGDDGPDLWNPVWNARLRPVTLRGELQDARYSFASAYHDVVTSMLILQSLSFSNFDPLQAILDFTQMERNMRAMGPSTFEGVTK